MLRMAIINAKPWVLTERFTVHVKYSMVNSKILLRESYIQSESKYSIVKGYQRVIEIWVWNLRIIIIKMCIVNLTQKLEPYDVKSRVVCSKILYQKWTAIHDATKQVLKAWQCSFRNYHAYMIKCLSLLVCATLFHLYSKHFSPTSSYFQNYLTIHPATYSALNLYCT